jgi:hypothetical protein
MLAYVVFIAFIAEICIGGSHIFISSAAHPSFPHESVDRRASWYSVRSVWGVLFLGCSSRASNNTCGITHLYETMVGSGGKVVLQDVAESGP